MSPVPDGGMPLAAWSRGIFGSALLHGVLALLVVLMMLRSMPHLAPQAPHMVPVDVVQFGDETTSPAASQTSLAPQQSASRHEPSAVKPQGTAPQKTHEPVDELESRLKQFAKLRQPDSNVAPLDNAGTSNVTASSDVPPGQYARYSVRDYIRAQVMRRWSLNLDKLGSRNFTVLLDIELNGRGTVTKAEIVDKARYRTDSVFRDIALSARNAVLLSSPLKLPDERLGNGIAVTLNLNPRDALR